MGAWERGGGGEKPYDAVMRGHGGTVKRRTHPRSNFLNLES